MKKDRLQYTELRSLDSAVEQLQALVDGLRAGVLSLERGDQRLTLKPGAVLDFALSAAREGEQERFELTLEWRRQELSMGSSPSRRRAPPPRSMPVPAGRGLALQAEAERLFDEDESDAPLSTDDDDTLAPDEVDRPLRPTGSQLPEEPAPAEPASASPARGEREASELEELDDEAVTVRHSSPPDGQRLLERRPVQPDAQWLQRTYAQARVPDGDGRLRLDEQRFTGALAAAGLEAQLQQELRSLARQADDDGRERLFEERSISELIASTLSGAA